MKIDSWSISLIGNNQPSNGKCNVYPTIGTVLIDWFNFSCIDWNETTSGSISGSIRYE